MGILNDLKRYSTLIRKLNKISDNLKILGRNEHIKKFNLMKNNINFNKITMPKDNKIVFNGKRIYSIEFIPSIEYYSKIIIEDETKEIYIRYDIEFNNLMLTEKKMLLSKLDDYLKEITDYKEYICGYLNKQVIDITDTSDMINKKTYEELLYDYDNKVLLKRVCNEVEDDVIGIKGEFNIPYLDINEDNNYKDFNDIFKKNNCFIEYDLDKFKALSNNYSKKLNKKPTK